MFDLRYHVASLAAVFLALLVGILVGAGISGRGLLDEAERTRLNDHIAALEAQLETERRRSRELEAAARLVQAALPALVANRLEGKRIAVLFVGSVDPALNGAVEDTVEAAGGRVVRLRALTVPLPVDELDSALARRPALAGYRGDDHLVDLGRDLARELLVGDETPLWDALTASLVEERSGDSRRPADAVVVVRTARPQRGDTARFLRGVYGGLAGIVPAVGVETSTADPSAVPVFDRSGLSSVDDLDTAVGKITLAVLLAGGKPGHYGIKQTARNGPVPPIEPVPAAGE